MRVLAVLAIAVILAGVPAAAQQSTRPHSVFLVVVPLPDGGTDVGTGFVASSDGLSITDSHVVFQAISRGLKVYAVFVGDGIAYDARVLCTSTLSYVPDLKKDGRLDRNQLSRDIAEMRLSILSVDMIRYATGMSARRGTVRVEPLTVSRIGAALGDTVTVDGYGFRPGRPIGEWTATGRVTGFYGLPADGTRVISLMFDGMPPTKGDSGAPVIDQYGNVVGVWTWDTYGGIGYAQASSEIADRPCGDVPLG